MCLLVLKTCFLLMNTSAFQHTSISNILLYISHKILLLVHVPIFSYTQSCSHAPFMPSSGTLTCTMSMQNPTSNTSPYMHPTYMGEIHNCIMLTTTIQFFEVTFYCQISVYMEPTHTILEAPTSVELLLASSGDVENSFSTCL